MNKAKIHRALSIAAAYGRKLLETDDPGTRRFIQSKILQAQEKFHAEVEEALQPHAMVQLEELRGKMRAVNRRLRHAIKHDDAATRDLLEPLLERMEGVEALLEAECEDVYDGDNPWDVVPLPIGKNRPMARKGGA